MVEKTPKQKFNQTELQFNTWLLPFLVAGSGVLYILTTFRGWLIFFIGFAGVWLLALLWVNSLKRNLHLDRKLHLAWATAGDSVQEELKLVNNSWLPAIWVEINDNINPASPSVRMVSDVGANSSRTRYLSHLYKQRGLYTLGPTTLRTGDPFGIYTLTFHEPNTDTILITPPLLPMTQLRIKPGGWAGDQQHQRGALERQISDAGVREYIPGDSLRRIHWHASAHFDSLIVRQLEASASGDWWIFVDLQSTVQAGNDQDSTLELLIVLAASLAVRGLNEHRRVGLAMAGTDLTWIEPSNNPTHRWRILKALAAAEAGDSSLADLISLKNPSRRASLIVITPSTGIRWIAALGKRRNDGRLALLIDPTEFGAATSQSRVKSVLAFHNIQYRNMPAALLYEAYQSLTQSDFKPDRYSVSGKRYLMQGRSTWQNMD